MKDTLLFVSVGTVRHNAKIALKYRLYEKGGYLKMLLTDIAAGRDGGTVALLFDESRRAYGTCVILGNGAIMAYVVPELRGLGWGGKLVLNALSCTTCPREKILAGPGVDVITSANFWKRYKIPCRGNTKAVALTSDEAYELLTDGRTLVCREAEDLDLTTVETLYINQLYTDEYSDEHDGIRGHLACILSENYSPVEYILFHAGEEFASCATVRERNHDVDGDTRKIVEIQLYVHEKFRKQGLGQQLIDKAKTLYPDRTLFGYHTPTAFKLMKRNEIEDLRRAP